MVYIYIGWFLSRLVLMSMAPMPVPAVLEQIAPVPKNSGVILTNESNKDRDTTSKKLHQYQSDKEIVILDPSKMSSEREKREAYQFKSGAIYDGEWKGAARDGFGVQTCNHFNAISRA